MKQIICLSTSPWFPLPTSKQQIMSRLKDAQVLYFDPPVTYLAPLKDKSAKEKLSAWKKDGQRISDSVTVYSLPPVLPFFNKKRSINRLNQKKLAKFICSVAEKHGFIDPILWVYSPSYVDIAELIPHSKLVYHCVDRHSAFGGLMDPELVDEMEGELAAKSDMVFATAEGLCQRLLPFNRKTEFIPNGANYEHFSRVWREELPCPDDMKDIKKPVIGFIGALQSCIEYSYAAYAAAQRPDWSFVFVGNRLPGVDLTALEALPNVHLLGVRPHEQIPAYISRFDVCLNLFASGELSKDVSPLKFYEYLATGKPIVSTPQPTQVLTFKDDIYVAANPEEFLARCAEALAENDDARTERRIIGGSQSSWDSRVEQISSILEGEGIF